jgi:hypothetical protein
MAVGFPTKTTYVDGDVFSASDINDTNGTINLLTSSTLSVAAGKNFIINGGMDIWQRGTSIALTSANTYCVDRFIASANTSGAATVSRQVTGDTTNLPFVQYCARFQRNSGNTATGTQFFNQPIETINSIPLAGKTVTVSFYARRGADFSSSGNVLTAQLRSGTGTDQSYLIAWTGDALLGSVNATLTTTWQRFQFTVTVGATANELTLPFTYTPTGTAGANDYYEVTGVQLELGSTATSFSRAGGTIQGELAACQRYYQVIQNTNSKIISNGYYNSATAIYSFASLPVQMRTVPTLSIVTGTNFYNAVSSGGNDNINSLSLAGDSSSRMIFLFNNTEASGTAGAGLYILTNNASSFIGVQAEL